MNGLLAALMKPTRRNVFVSYHHGGDQTYYEQFSHFFHGVRISTHRDRVFQDRERSFQKFRDR